VKYPKRHTIWGGGSIMFGDKSYVAFSRDF